LGVAGETDEADGKVSEKGHAVGGCAEVGVLVVFGEDHVADPVDLSAV
jgi:hypothetical protein